MFRRLAPYLVVFAGLGFFACLGAMLGIAGIGRRLHGDFRTATGPRWLLWVYLAGLGAGLFYVFYRFP